MTVFTVHEPKPKKREEAASPDRYAFVRDGFHFWAFLFGPVWMLYRRLWLVFVLYALGMMAVTAALWALAASMPVKLAVAFLIALLVGFEAGSLRRWSLRRWTARGIVVAPNREAAEHRFFDRWAGRPAEATDLSAPPASPSSPPLATSPAMRVPTSDQDVIGLFPLPQPRQ